MHPTARAQPHRCNPARRPSGCTPQHARNPTAAIRPRDDRQVARGNPAATSLF
ncbi:hypothetical protein ACFPM0_09030 [Pseudonocardia sulfidoxydans]|uniref:hypothetical protein n=1 Tax=Pseudonocardia sulfidoxydans TaxID=54011 RepID=UPI003614CD24